MTRQKIQQRAARTAVALGIALALVGTAVVTAGASDGKVTDKMKKQIRVMEGMLDSILLDSPNLLVAGSHVTHGLYLDEFGVILAFEASLTGGGFDFGKSMEFLKNFRIETDKDRTIIWHEGSDEEEAKKELEEAKKDLEEAQKDLEEAKKQAEHAKQEQERKVYVIGRDGEAKGGGESAKETYEKGKQELIDALVDYGETLTSLQDDQWVAIAAFLKDNQYFSDQKISRLVIKARIRDLRASAQMSRDAMLGRMVIEEY